VSDRPTPIVLVQYDEFAEAFRKSESTPPFLTGLDVLFCVAVFGDFGVDLDPELTIRAESLADLYSIYCELVVQFTLTQA